MNIADQVLQDEVRRVIARQITPGELVKHRNDIEDELDAARGIVIAIPAALLAWAVIAAAAIAFKFFA